MAASLEIREIVASEWAEPAWALFSAHCDELATNKALMRLKPDLDAYRRMEATGKMLSLGLFDSDELVGYSINLITRNLHYSDLLVCQNDVLFLRSDLRGGRAGLNLMRETEARAKASADGQPIMMLWHAKPGTPLEGLLPKLGYGVQDVIYSRELR